MVSDRRRRRSRAPPRLPRLATALKTTTPPVAAEGVVKAFLIPLLQKEVAVAP